jgi:hypothetical protein
MTRGGLTTGPGQFGPNAPDPQAGPFAAASRIRRPRPPNIKRRELRAAFFQTSIGIASAFCGTAMAYWPLPRQWPSWANLPWVIATALIGGLGLCVVANGVERLGCAVARSLHCRWQRAPRIG